MDIPNSATSSEDEENNNCQQNKKPQAREYSASNRTRLCMRRNANDPRMMRELQRYRRIMFLTLLPSISSNENPPSTQQSANLNTIPALNSCDIDNTSVITMQHPKYNAPINNRKTSMQERKSSFPNLAAIQTEKARRISDIGNRRQGLNDSLTSLTTNKKLEPVSVVNNQDIPNANIEQPNIDQVGNNLDFTTLTALYLESRKKIFGDQWTNRRCSLESKREEIGSTGIIKPRRLTPLETGIDPIDIPGPYTNNFHNNQGLPLHTMPTPAGLHLSANFSQSFGLDLDRSRDKSRKGSHHSRFRRLRSMDELSLAGTEGEENSFHRPTSAPGIPKKLDDQEGDMLPMETPARANTPTEYTNPAKCVRIQMIGGSLATYSPDQSMRVSDKKSPSETSVDNLYPSRHTRRSLPSATLSLPIREDTLASPILKRPPRKDSRLRLTPIELENKKKHSYP